MSRINELQDKFGQGDFEFSKHAVDQTITREISVQEIREAIKSAEIIEDYPEDKYGPSLLLFGLTNDKRPIHIQCSYPSRPLVKVITVYEPDPDQWIAFQKRK
jgi:hypothetical protein